jgi:hypothetical protein
MRHPDMSTGMRAAGKYEVEKSHTKHQGYLKLRRIDHEISRHGTGSAWFRLEITTLR